MKNTFYVVFILLILSQSSFALTRGDVKIMEARENIQYLGQKITTDYFLLYTQPHNIVLQNQFQATIKKLEKNIKDISNSTQNIITQNILMFYRYRLGYIKSLSIQNPIKKDAILLLEASNYFLEGARSIENEHKYKSSKEENMLVHCKELLYLIESVSKYYMAFHVGLKNKELEFEMRTAVLRVEKDLQDLSKYEYNIQLRKKLSIIKNIWEHNQGFFLNKKEIALPHLLLTSNEYMKELLMYLEKHHKQNL